MLLNQSNQIPAQNTQSHLKLLILGGVALVVIFVVGVVVLNTKTVINQTALISSSTEVTLKPTDIAPNLTLTPSVDQTAIPSPTKSNSVFEQVTLPEGTTLVPMSSGSSSIRLGNQTIGVLEKYDRVNDDATKWFKTKFPMMSNYTFTEYGKLVSPGYIVIPNNTEGVVSYFIKSKSTEITMLTIPNASKSSEIYGGDIDKLKGFIDSLHLQ